ALTVDQLLRGPWSLPPCPRRSPVAHHHLPLRARPLGPNGPIRPGGCQGWPLRQGAQICPYRSKKRRIVDLRRPPRKAGGGVGTLEAKRAVGGEGGRGAGARALVDQGGKGGSEPSPRHHRGGEGDPVIVPPGSPGFWGPGRRSRGSDGEPPLLPPAAA